MTYNIYSREQHKIDPALIDSDALWVLSRLRSAGYQAYLVGGGVRDLLIGCPPKDFDISTSARPEEVKALFKRQCLLIGRRFRLAHIRFGHKVIEVATFRSGESDSEFITEDNQWGTPEEDALRRDFTINGLFYDSHDQTVIDYVGGWSDIQNHFLRVIGDPITRFKQDPVRLLRLLKFQARYGFITDHTTLDAALHCREEILKSSPARVLEEVFRMLESGAASAFFRLLAERQLLHVLFPSLMHRLYTPAGKKAFQYLSAADHLYRHRGKNTLDREVLLACLVFPLLEEELQERYLKHDKIPHIGEITLSTSGLVHALLIADWHHFPRKLSSGMISVLVAQYRLTPLAKKKQGRDRFLRHKDSSNALRFLKLRAMVDSQLVAHYTALKQQHRRLAHQGERKHHSPPPPSSHRQPNASRRDSADQRQEKPSD